MLREVAFVAYHFHWSREEICTMPHPERRQWVEEINRLNLEASGQE